LWKLIRRNNNCNFLLEWGIMKKNMSLREYMIWGKNEDDRFCLEDKK
jgi:hypothetical protein